MKKLLLVLICVFFPLWHAGAAVDVAIKDTIEISGKPLDTALSGDNKYFYVLGDNGKVHIYSAANKLLESIDVDKNINIIDASQDGSTLYLTNAKSGTVQILSMEFVQNIGYEGVAFKGKAKAPVVVAVFSDFQ